MEIIISSYCIVLFPLLPLKINQGTPSVHHFNFLSSIVWTLSIPFKTQYFSTFPRKLNNHIFLYGVIPNVYHPCLDGPGSAAQEETYMSISDLGYSSRVNWRQNKDFWKCSFLLLVSAYFHEDFCKCLSLFRLF